MRTLPGNRGTGSGASSPPDSVFSCRLSPRGVLRKHWQAAFFTQAGLVVSAFPHPESADVVSRAFLEGTGTALAALGPRQPGTVLAAKAVR